MSDVKANDFQPINGLDDVWPLYTGAGPAGMKLGVEVELAFFNPANHQPMSIAQNMAVKNAADATHETGWMRNEPTSDTLEATSIARPLGDIAQVLEDTQSKIQTLVQKAADIGIKRSWFQDLPDQTAAQLFAHLMPVDRYRAFWGPPRADMKDIAGYFAVCKSDQVSVSYADPAHMLENVRRLYFLAPLLFMLTDNSSGFNEGKKFCGHSGMQHRHTLGPRGGVMPYVFTARTGDEYLRAHIDHVMSNPLFVYYDENGALQKLPSGQWTSFNQLREQGLNTASNYFLAQSVLWPDVKIAALRDGENNVTGHRYEARMFGVGIHQHRTAALIVGALAHDQAFARRVDMLLATYGFKGEAAASHLAKAYESARNHNGKFFDIVYGSGQMSDFAQRFADLLEQAYAGIAHQDAIGPALSILRTGWPDARVNRCVFPTLESVLAQQKSYDPGVFDNPDRCAYDLFAPRLAQGLAGRSICC